MSDRFPPVPGERKAATSRKVTPPQKARRPTDPSRNRLYNRVAAAFAIGAVLLLIIFAFLWFNYDSPLNPLAPPTPLAQVVTATYTPTDTLTPSITPTLAPTRTSPPQPTIAPSTTFTPVVLAGFITPGTAEAGGSAATPGGPTPVLATDGPTPEGGYPYNLQRAGIVYLTNPDSRGGCRWSSIVGSVLSFEGSAINGYSIRVIGESVDQTVTSGSSPGFGPGGFEIALGNEAQAADYTVQLFDPNGVTVSAPIPVRTRDDCAYTIAAVRFVAAFAS